MSVRLASPILTPLSPDDCLDWFDLSSRPLLAFARSAAAPAHSVKIEWLVDHLEDGQVKQTCLSNYTQILRRPFRRKYENGKLESLAEAVKRGGNQMLDDAEKVLWYGKPGVLNSNGHPVSMCGGVLHYLRRRVYQNDRVALRELSGLRPYWSRGRLDAELPEEEHTHEWIWEFSLQVNPGHYQRGMKPLFPPPDQEPVKAWAQGASLDQGVPA